MSGNKDKVHELADLHGENVDVAFPCLGIVAGHCQGSGRLDTG